MIIRSIFAQPCTYQNEEINYHRTDKEALAGGDVISTHTRGKACEMEPSMIVRISSQWPNKTLIVFKILTAKHNAQCSIVFGEIYILDVLQLNIGVIHKGCSLRKSISPKTSHLLLDTAQMMRSTLLNKFLPWIPGREVDQKPFRRKCNRRPTCRSGWSTQWNRATHRVDDTTRSPPRGET